MKDKVQVVQDQLDAYNAFDLDKYCACFHKDITVMLLREDVVLIQGMEEFREAYRALFEKYPKQNCILQSRVVSDETVVDEEIIMGRPSHPEGLYATATYAFRDGVIDRVWLI